MIDAPICIFDSSAFFLFRFLGSAAPGIIVIM